MEEDLQYFVNYSKGTGLWLIHAKFEKDFIKTGWLFIFEEGKINKHGCDPDAIGPNGHFMDGFVSSHTKFNSKPLKKVDFHVN